MMRIFFCILLMLSGAVVTAQNIKILDVDSGEPIENAFVYNKDTTKTALTNNDGFVNVLDFGPNERIYISHVSYTVKSIIKRKIKNKRVYLYPNTQQLDEIVLSVSKWQQQKRHVPQKIVSLSANTVLFTTPQTSADLLQQSGQVFVQKSQLGGGSPMIRGFATNRLLLSVDGVRMNNAIFRGGNIQNVISVDPFSIKKTEVIFGPGSVIYGSDAIGGVLNFYTQSPTLSNTDSLDVSGKSVVRYSSANSEKTGHARIAVGSKKWGSLTSISYSDFGDLTMGKNGPDDYLRPFYVTTTNNQDNVVTNTNPREQVPTGFNQVGVLQKIKYVPNSRWDFQLGLHYNSTSNYARYDRLIRTRNGEPRSAEWYYGPQRWFMVNLQTEHNNNATIYDAVKLTTAYQYFRESRHNRDFQDSIKYHNIERVNAYSFNADFEKAFSTKTKVFYGVEYVLNKVQSNGKQENIVTNQKEKTASRYPDGASWQTVAGYANVEHKAGSKVTLLTGIRYSHAFINAIFDNTYYNLPFTNTKVDNGALTGSFGLSWFPGNQWQITINGATGFRAPNIDDIGKVFDSEPGAVVVPNPDLEAEYAYNTEIGIRKNFNDKLIISTAAFYTYLKDALVRRDFTLNGQDVINYQGEPSQVQAIQNAAKATVYGLELALQAYFTEQLSITSNVTITEGEEELDNGETASLRHAAPLFGDVHMLFKSDRLKIDASVLFNGSIKYADLAPSEQRKAYLYASDSNGNPYSPSWYTFNIRTQYKLSENLNATAAVENITDQRYRPYSSGIAGPGRNLILSLSYRF